MAYGAGVEFRWALGLPDASVVVAGAINGGDIAAVASLLLAAVGYPIFAAREAA